MAKDTEEDKHLHCEEEMLAIPGAHWEELHIPAGWVCRKCRYTVYTVWGGFGTGAPGESYMSEERLQELDLKDKIANATTLEVELVWLPKIMRNQTEEEIDNECTKFDNKLGLNGRDAPIVTSMYKKVKSGKHLTDNQASCLRKILPKYWRQYAKISKY